MTKSKGGKANVVAGRVTAKGARPSGLDAKFLDDYVREHTAPKGAVAPSEEILRKRLPITTKQQLERRSLLPPPQDQQELFVVPGVLTRDECAAVVQLCESGDFPALAWDNISHPATREMAARNNDRVSFESSTLAGRLWLAGLDLVFKDISSCSQRGGRAVGLNKHFRIYKYVKGMLFGQHFDTQVEDSSGHESEYTLLIYLTGGPHDDDTIGRCNGEHLVGGETVFYRSKGRELASASPEVGMALLHTQGPKSLLHESAVVRRGIKYVLRSDVMFAS